MCRAGCSPLVVNMHWRDSHTECLCPFCDALDRCQETGQSLMPLPVATGTWPGAAFGLQVSLQTPCCLLSLISAGRGIWESGCSGLRGTLSVRTHSGKRPLPPARSGLPGGEESSCPSCLLSPGRVRPPPELPTLRKGLPQSHASSASLSPCPQGPGEPGGLEGQAQ